MRGWPRDTATAQWKRRHDDGGCRPRRAQPAFRRSAPLCRRQWCRWAAAFIGQRSTDGCPCGAAARGQVRVQPPGHRPCKPDRPNMPFRGAVATLVGCNPVAARLRLNGTNLRVHVATGRTERDGQIRCFQAASGPGPRRAARPARRHRSEGQAEPRSATTTRHLAENLIRQGAQRSMISLFSGGILPYSKKSFSSALKVGALAP